MTKRGQLSIETIVVIILALLALVVIAASFTGGMKNLWEKISGISNTASEVDLQTAITRCKALCSNGQTTNAFETTSIFVKDAGPKNCKDITAC